MLLQCLARAAERPSATQARTREHPASNRLKLRREVCAAHGRQQNLFGALSLDHRSETSELRLLREDDAACSLARVTADRAPSRARAPPARFGRARPRERGSSPPKARRGQVRASRPRRDDLTIWAV